MIDHVAFYVSDLDRSRKFYEQALAPLGYGVAFEMEGMVGYGPGGRPRLAIRVGEEAIATAHVAFAADDHAHRGRLPRCRAGGRRAGQRRSRHPRALPPDVLRRLRARPGRQQRRGRQLESDRRVTFDPLTEEQRELRELVRTIARERVGPRAAEIDESHEFPWDVVEVFREQGVFGLLFDEEWGGTGTGVLLALVAIEELSKVCATSGLIIAVQELGSLGHQARRDARAAGAAGCRGSPPASCCARTR